MTTTSNQEYDGFGGRFSDSNKIPNLAMAFENHQGDLLPGFVLEIGFSESYGKLIQDARMWLEGSLCGGARKT
jgi:hypothetical protein